MPSGPPISQACGMRRLVYGSRSARSASTWPNSDVVSRGSLLSCSSVSSLVTVGDLRCADRRGPQPLPDDRPDAIGNDVTWRAAVDHDAALRLLRSERAVSLSELLVKVHGLRLEPIGGPLPAATFGAGEPDLRRNIEDERKLWDCRPYGYPLEAADQSLIDVAESPLINAR